MKNGIHFISGLPRAGSTLLAALLRQNPRFSAGMTSPVGSLFNAMLTATSARNEGAVFLDLVRALASPPCFTPRDRHWPKRQGRWIAQALSASFEIAFAGNRESAVAAADTLTHPVRAKQSTPRTQKY
jgi:hypothetical protein